MDIEPVTTETLEFVMKHVFNSTTRPSCKLDIIHLHFVYGSSQSYEKFVQEFSKIVIPNYKLLKQDEIYYLAKHRDSINNEKKYCLMSLSGLDKLSNEIRAKDTSDIHSVDSFDVKVDNMNDSDLVLSQSDISSINDSMIGTEGGTYFRLDY